MFVWVFCHASSCNTGVALQKEAQDIHYTIVHSADKYAEKCYLFNLCEHSNFV